MTWSRRFRLRESVRGSLWVIPLIGALSGALLGWVVVEIDHGVSAPSAWDYSSTTANSVLTAIVSATAALTGFVVTVTVLVVQMATGTFSARYMRLWYRDGMLKGVLAILVGTLTLSLSLLRSIESDFVPDFGVTLASALVILSLLLFLLFFSRVIHRLRPVAVAANVGRAGRTSFLQSVALADRADIRWESAETTAEPTAVVRAAQAGSIQAVDPDGLVRWASAHGVELVVTHAVGDFVPTDASLVQIYGGDGMPAGAEDELRGMIALGDERTIQQDPAFAIRVMVDIAIRALSPAVNDPTTAVQVLDHLGEVLRLIGATDLEKRTEGAPGRAQPAVVMRARSWEDFLALGVTEIREYGATSIQVMRRLRAVLEELRATVRPEHGAAVDDEIRRLDATVAEHWGGSVDLDRVSVAGPQGIGGASA